MKIKAVVVLALSVLSLLGSMVISYICCPRDPHKLE